MTQPRDFGFDEETSMLKDAAARFFDGKEMVVKLRPHLKGTEDPYRGNERAPWYDEAAWQELVALHTRRVFGLAYRFTGRVDEAEDLTQEVFIRAWNKLSTFKGQSQFGTWLHRLAVNHVLSRRQTQRKREARHTGDTLLGRVMAPTRRSSGHALDIEAAIGKLPS